MVFSQKLAPCLSLEVELWSIYHGLSVAWGKGFSRVIVESDSVQVVDLLFSLPYNNHPHQQLVLAIKSIGDGEADIHRKKIDRDHNCVAGTLAKHYFSFVEDCVIFDYIPDFLAPVFNSDRVGLAGPAS